MSHKTNGERLEAKEQKPPKRKLWKRIIWNNIIVDPASKCWLWTPRSGEGYARTTVPALGRIYAHRLAWIAYNGEIPENVAVIHVAECRRRYCVNPDHLRLAEAEQVVEERNRRGTTATGERHGRRKVTQRVVDLVRAVSDRTPDEAIALAFDLSVDHVRKIRTGHYWKESA